MVWKGAILLASAAAALCGGVVNAVKVLPLFENTAIVRNIELGGSEVHVTTSYSARALASGAKTYFFAIPKEEDERTSWLDAKIKGKTSSLEIQKYGVDAVLHTSDPVVLYSVDLPKALDADGTITLLVNAVQIHSTTPLPATAAQAEVQSLTYDTSVYVTSPYGTVSQRTKLRSPNPTIHSYSDFEELKKFASDASVTKSGAAVTYGPFSDIPPSTDLDFATTTQQTVTIHYVFENPVLGVAHLTRLAEVSHWGANLNIQDSIQLRNNGPTLKGHFSRLLYQQQTYAAQLKNSAKHILHGLVLHLPPNVRDPYYTDIIGNVSTSSFRPAPPQSLSRGGERWSLLQLKPRYPLLGGWNYTFTLGYDLPLGDWARYNGETKEYVVGIPFFTQIPDAVIDDAEVKVILPEGASVVSIHPPFSVDSIERETHITFLDTTGRPAIIFRKQGLTAKHTGLIYVTYTVSLAAHFAKVITVAIAVFSLFSLVLVIRRVDTRIHKSV